MISYNLDKKEFGSETDGADPQTEVIFDSVDVSKLKQATISHEVIISAMDYTMTK